MKKFRNSPTRDKEVLICYILLVMTERLRVSKLVFYAQSTITVISGPKRLRDRQHQKCLDTLKSKS